MAYYFSPVKYLAKSLLGVYSDFGVSFLESHLQGFKNTLVSEIDYFRDMEFF